MIKCVNCSYLIEPDGSEVHYWCEYLGIEIEDPAEEGCEIYP